MFSDDEAVAAVQRGNHDAFRDLVDRHGEAVYAILRRIVRDPDLAEEMAQETFVKAFNAIKGFRGHSSVGTWLVQIAVNLARDRHRSNQRRPVLVSLDSDRETSEQLPESWRTGGDETPLRHLEQKELAARLDHEIARLPADFREVFVLKHVHDHSYEEISEMTGDSVGTLKVRAHRCRRMLRKRLSSRSRQEECDGNRTRKVSGWRPVR